ncbi:hypothetical protein GGI20_003253 [Coemansia sp. BCRC 34301]|nr:hypothetical protein GGI20_003253 [Coemansia sp. BCRC 34301]
MVESLTDQQTAEMVELLTRAYSPLTSPALMPQGNAPMFMGGALAMQPSSNEFVSMLPPSPSITAEHIMRRQQLMMQHSPSFPSVSVAALSPYMAATMNGGSRSAKRRGSVSAVANTSAAMMSSNGGSHSMGSPQYHPYRTQSRQPVSSIGSPLINNSHQMGHPQLTYTPSLLSRTGTTDSDNFFLDSLPTSAALPQQQARNRTLHQLNASPHFTGNSLPVPPPAQRSVSLNSAALAMLSNNSHYSSADDSLVTADQVNLWLDVPSTAPLLVSDNQAARASATPASLMNLPLSAHHLPHSANGEIVSSEESSGQSPSTASAIVSAFGRQQIGTNTSSGPLLQFVTQSAPMPEFVHPPQPPPLHIGPSSSTGPDNNNGKATSTTNIVGLEADVVTRLATKSNYQNIMEGNSEFLGLRYKTEFKSGLERRRTNHKQAEQKRRDSLKTCFQSLEKRLPDLDPKLVSKIYLLRSANAYIDELVRMNGLLRAAAEERGVDVAAIAAQARDAADLAGCSEDEDEEESNDDDMQVDKKR